jgi:O-antigen/teichoic acid export membrane protein
MALPLAERARAAFAQNASLIKNSGAIALGAGFTSIFGFAYWWFAARLFSPEILGIASAIISLVNVAAIIGDGGLSTLVVGEIIRWPQRRSGVVAAALLTSLCACLVIGVASLPFSGFVLSPKPSVFTATVLVIGCGLSALQNICDQAFVGMLQSTLRMLRQLVWSVLRLASLLIFSIWFANELVLLISWFGSVGLSLIFGETLLRRQRQSFVHRPDFDLLWKLRTRAVDHYMLDIGMLVPAFILPYLVTVLVSATSNAPFTVIWCVIAVGSLVPGALTLVLFPVLRAEPDQYREKMRLSLITSLVFAIVFAVVLWMSSSTILAIFNPSYLQIEDASYLGFLGFGLIGCVVRYHVAAAARLDNRMRQMSLWVLLAGISEVAGAAVGSRYGGLAGLCIGYPIATTIEGLMMWAFANPISPPDTHEEADPTP